MSMSYLRKTYKVPVKRGGRVRFKFFGEWYFGTIRSATHYVHVEPDQIEGFKVRIRFHPCDENLIYLSKAECQQQEQSGRGSDEQIQNDRPAR